MKIGRGLTPDGSAVLFASEDGARFFACDPETLRPGNPVEIVRMLAPVMPSKVVAVGLNYRDHAQELGLDLPKEPVLFIKPSTCIIGPNDDIVYPEMSSRLDYEAELGIVIGDRCRDVSVEDAQRYILGYTCFNDVTARDIQLKDAQWTRAKAFDTFGPIGPWIVTDIEDPHDLSIKAYLNNEVKQSSNTSNLIFGVYELVEFISHVMTLERGDVIITGTPSGIGPMARGDEISIEIQSIGVLNNTVT